MFCSVFPCTLSNSWFFDQPDCGVQFRPTAFGIDSWGLPFSIGFSVSNTLSFTAMVSAYIVHLLCIWDGPAPRPLLVVLSSGDFSFHAAYSRSRHLISGLHLLTVTKRAPFRYEVQVGRVLPQIGYPPLSFSALILRWYNLAVFGAGTPHHLLRACVC